MLMPGTNSCMSGTEATGQHSTTPGRCRRALQQLCRGGARAFGLYRP